MKTFKFRDETITEQQIREDLEQLDKDNKLFYSDTDTYNLWMNFAEDWFTDSDEIRETLRHGFRGFLERSVEDILQDFEINCEECFEDKGEIV